ncbi:hypothetical protein [Desulfovibrio ferrophilus]|uniref:Putative integron gene cassette protein n=1 Tax=Desulfovibrio ferrophilus TaxID=241368 RepID=A0A2Z6AX78_9BACT|nr:hypothetical protein [Desulfovibrio ferrophilus]BBD07862.1 putative integron gene cassette protein [Desulfovibrio ferrophilus]
MLSGKGSYLGTEMDFKWYRRYRADGYFVRGSGEWWFTEDAFCFKRKLLATPMEIPFASIVNVRTGTWHAGKWVIRPVVVKLDWHLDGRQLCSGFVFAKTHEGTRQMAAHIEALSCRH